VKDWRSTTASAYIYNIFHPFSRQQKLSTSTQSSSSSADSSSAPVPTTAAPASLPSHKSSPQHSSAAAAAKSLASVNLSLDFHHQVGNSDGDEDGNGDAGRKSLAQLMLEVASPDPDLQFPSEDSNSSSTFVAPDGRSSSPLMTSASLSCLTSSFGNGKADRNDEMEARHDSAPCNKEVMEIGGGTIGDTQRSAVPVEYQSICVRD
jgi:hypothetical protein